MKEKRSRDRDLNQDGRTNEGGDRKRSGGGQLK
jgi:hypothetical protein